jgi:hypothetical protein
MITSPDVYLHPGWLFYTLPPLSVEFRCSKRPTAEQQRLVPRKHQRETEWTILLDSKYNLKGRTAAMLIPDIFMVLAKSNADLDKSC